MDAVQQQLGDVRDQLGGALEFMMDDLRQKWREISGGPSVTDGILQFVHAVDWSVSSLKRACYGLICLVGRNTAMYTSRGQLGSQRNAVPPLRLPPCRSAGFRACWPSTSRCCLW